MTAPLYKTVEHPYKKPDHAHVGLWFDRFFDRYQVSGQDWEIPKPDDKQDAKRDWIKTVSGPIGNGEQLQAHIQRQTTLVSYLNGRSERYRSDWHFVTGMGNPHPVENGMSWHPTLGVPFLAGSAVKGLVRAWVEGNDDGLDDEPKKARLKRWFGTEKKDDVPEQAGGFIFFDALPNQRPNLLCDIMTPHMGDWYSDGDKADISKPETIPADWHEPVPVTFLVVKKTQLVFSIAPRIPELAKELDAVFIALTNALEWLGAGAKTAKGYGYFSPDDDFAKEQAETAERQAAAQRLSALTAEQQLIEALRQTLQQKQSSNVREQVGGPLYTDLRTLVAQTGNWPADVKLELLVVAKELLAFIGGQKNAKAKELLNRLQ